MSELPFDHVPSPEAQAETAISEEAELQIEQLEAAKMLIATTVDVMRLEGIDDAKIKAALFEAYRSINLLNER